MRRPASSIVLAGLILAGCQPTPRPRPAISDPEVAARCTPVDELLAKNYERRRKVDALIASAGDYVAYSGAVLNSADAKRIASIDYACRAWVHGSLSDDQYSVILLQGFAGSAIDASDGLDPAATLDAIRADLATLQERKLVPASFDPGQLEAEIRRLQSMDEAQRAREIEEALRPISLLMDVSNRRFDVFEAGLASRLQLLEAEIAALKGNPAGQIETKAGPIMVFFSTDSAELTFSARQLLDRASIAWVSSGTRLLVVGSADPRGSAQRNHALSDARARAVAEYLRALGVNVDAVEGLGADPATTPDMFDRMRRVEIRPLPIAD